MGHWKLFYAYILSPALYDTPCMILKSKSYMYITSYIKTPGYDTQQRGKAKQKKVNIT